MKDIQQTFTEHAHKLKETEGAAKEYHVQILARSKFLKTLLGLFILIIVGTALDIFLRPYISPIVFSISTLVLIVALVVYGLTQITEKAVIILNENEIKIFSQAPIVIPFREIASYQIIEMRGISLIVTLQNKQKITLGSPSYFCETQGMLNFVDDFDLRMTELNADKRIQAVRTPGFLETKTALAVMISLTVVMVIGLGWLVSINGHFNGSLGMSMVGLSVLWAGYFAARKRKADHRKNQGSN